MSAKNHPERSGTATEDAAALTEKRREWLLELLCEQTRNPKQNYPTNTGVIASIKNELEPLPSDELSGEIPTAEDYENWVYQALCNLMAPNPRIYTHPVKSDTVECPRKRLLRIGAEAEREGKPSELFREIMEITDNGAKLPTIADRTMRKAQQYLKAATEFKRFIAENPKRRKSYPDIKADFWMRQRLREKGHLPMSTRTIERALKAHDLNWSAYDIASPRKGRRKKPANS